MKSASPELISLLASKTFVMADIYTFTLRGGTVVRYTSADIDLTVSGNTFSSMGPKIKRNSIRTVMGVEVDTLELEIYPKDTDLLAGVPFLQALRSGALDNASLLLERSFMATWGDTSAGTLILFSGRIADMDFSRFGSRITVKSDTELLNVQIPRNIYQPTCLNTLYDVNCGKSKATYEALGQLASGSTQSVLNTNLTGFDDGWFALGILEFLTGPNAGVKRAVKEYLSGVIRITVPLEAVPTVGDTFKIYPGCNKLKNTCGTKFSNLSKFRGFPFVPKPETAL